MRVLIINSVCGIKSTGRICTDIAEALQNEGHECKIAFGRDTVPLKYQKYAVRIGTDTGVKIHALKARVCDKSGFGSRLATERFIKWVKDYNPDVIHLHNIHGYYINVEVLFNYLKSCGKKIVWTLHDCWSFTGHCTQFECIGCGKWKNGCANCSQIREYPKSYFIDNSRLNYKKKKRLFTDIPQMTIVTPSEWLAGLVRNSYLSNYPVMVINNGIDLSLFRPTNGNFREKYGLENKKIILGVASTWSAKKGLNDFIKLSQELDNDYKIVLIGLTAKQLKDIPDTILGIEKTDNVNELAQIYTTSDVFFNPTYEDTFPTTNLEAEACGTPAVTYNICGCSETILKGMGRCIIPDNNISETIDIIVDACGNKVNSEKNRYNFSQKFDKGIMSDNYRKLYEM